MARATSAFVVLVAAQWAVAIGISQAPTGSDMQHSRQGLASAASFDTAGWGENPLKQVSAATDLRDVSTAMKCVIILAVQFLLVYSILAAVRAYAQYHNMKFGDIAAYRVLACAASTVNYAPMLAVLFLACRMRVTFQSQGKDNAPEWWPVCMYVCTCCVLLATVVVCAIPVFTGEVKGFRSLALAGLLTAAKFLLLCILYVSAAAVVYGLVTYTPPAGTWPKGQEPGVSAAVQCTAMLACQFFLVYFLLHCARTHSQLSGTRCSRLEGALEAAALVMSCAPMLAILFMGARMRSLQMDPVWGKPQQWAQIWFYVCTGALSAQAACAAAVVLVTKSDKVVQSPIPERDPEVAGSSTDPAPEPLVIDPQIQYEVRNKNAGNALVVARYVFMLCVYVGFSAIVWSVLTIEHRDGPTNTPAISVTMQCVLLLVVVFFTHYFVVSIWQTLRELTGHEYSSLTQTMEALTATAQICPMLLVLFLSVRVRSLIMTNGLGSPQAWAQDAMYVSCWIIVFQYVLCLVAVAIVGAPNGRDAKGKLRGQPKTMNLWVGLEGVNVVCWGVLWANYIVITYAVATMTPETATGRGSIPPLYSADVKPPGVPAP